ncbi:hypothetical protein AGATL06_29730 [Agathobaculum sp. TL06]
MFAGAAFTDEADIQAKDAVNMLTALGVIEGDPDGSFRPDATVTRAEMAKMIFVVRNNSIDDSAYENNSSKMTDISTHWAKGYIKFCESQGIIAGYGDNTFKPDATVTGVEAAKMLLVLAGYDADKAGLVGHNWSTNTLRYAGSAGILDDVNSGLEQGLPRQYAAQMIANTLDTNRVKWSTDSDSFDDILNGGVKETVGSAYMGLSYDYGTLTSIETDSLTIKIDADYDSDNYHNSDRNYSNGDLVNFTKVSEDYTSLLGQKVKVMFKDGKTNNVLGVYAVSDNTVYNTLMKNVELDGQKLKFEGSSYSVDSTKSIDLTFVGVDGVETDTVAYTYFDKDAAPNDHDTNGNTSLAEVTFVDSDGNNKIDTAIVFEKIGGEVTNVASDKITFAGKSYKFADEIIDEELVADDYAVMSYSMYEDCKEIVKADVVTDELEGSKNKTSANGNYSQYEIAGTWYNIDTMDSDTGYDNVSVGDTVLAYVANGVILNIDTDDGTGAIPTNIAVVVGNASGGGTNTLYGDQVKLRYFDGTLKTVTIDDDNSIAGSATELGRAYKVSGSDSSTKLEELKGSGTSGDENGQKYNGYKTLIYGSYSSDELDVELGSSNKIADKRVADDAVIVVWDENGSSKTITGKQFNNLASDADLVDNGGAGAVFTKDYNGLDRVRLASVEVATGHTIGDISGTSNDNYGYITADAVERNNGDITYTLWNGSENLSVTEENGDASDRAKGTVIGYGSIDADGYIQDVDDSYGLLKNVTNRTPDLSDLAVGANKASATRSISVGDDQLNVTADTKVLVIDSSEDDDEIGQPYTYGSTTLRKADKDVNDDYMDNVAFILDEDVVDGEADLELLIIDNNGKFDWIDDGSDDGDDDDEEDNTSTSAGVTVTKDMAGDAMTYGGTSDEETLSATVEGMKGYYAEVSIVDSSKADASSKFTTSVVVDGSGSQITTNDAALINVTITNDQSAAAGKYTMTLTIGSKTVVRDFTVAKDDVTAVAISNFAAATTGGALADYDPDATALTATTTPAAAGATVSAVTVDEDESTVDDESNLATGDIIKTTFTITLTDTTNYQFDADIDEAAVTGIATATVESVSLNGNVLTVTTTQTL